MPTRERDDCLGADGAAAFVSGDMTEDERAIFQRHVDDCQACLSELQQARALLGVLREPTDRSERNVADAVMESIPESAWNARRPHLVTVRWFLISAASVAAVLILTVRMAEVPRNDLDQSGQAVARALDWLASAQAEDGSWDPLAWGGQRLYQPGVTGLALLAFTGGGREAVRGRHRATVVAAVSYLLSLQSKEGRIGPAFSSAPYNHGIATVSLLEYYAAERPASLRVPLGLAVKAIVDSRNADGGWGYADDSPSNMSVTVWHMHALLLAERLGWPEVSDVATLGLEWVASRVDPDGFGAYSAANVFPYGQEGTTAMAALCMLAGSRQVDHERLRGLIGNVEAFAASPFDGSSHYNAFFITNVLALRSDAPHPSLPIVEQLKSLQIREGDTAGSWPPNDRWALAGGRVYSTAMAAMSLQSHRRASMLTGLISGRGL